MAAPQVDVLAATRAGAQSLGAQIADLTLELAVQQTAGQQMMQRLAELEQQVERIPELERQLAEKDDALAATRGQGVVDQPET